MGFRQRTDRSIKRWGRFPRPDFKKKQYATSYSELEETAMVRGGGTTDIVLFNDADFHTPDATGVHVGVRNVSVDMKMMVTWTPEVTTLAYDSWFLKWGVFVKDSDDTADTLDTEFASAVAICWDAQGFNTCEQPTALGDSGAVRAWNVRKRFRVRYLRRDEEIRFLIAFNNDVTATIADARLSIFARFRFELP